MRQNGMEVRLMSWQQGRSQQRGLTVHAQRCEGGSDALNCIHFYSADPRQTLQEDWESVEELRALWLHFLYPSRNNYQTNNW